MMSKLVRELKPWLWLSAAQAHRVANPLLRISTIMRPYKSFEWRPLDWRGLHFSNRLGLAAGADKDASQVKSWWRYGVGFLEVGTVVPEPQKANPGKILARDLKAGAVWNRMGFPSRGLKKFKSNLIDLGMEHRSPIFINIGKNRNTPNESAASDYVRLIQELSLFADAFVVNISSPNTKGLRELLTETYLEQFLGPIVEARNLQGNAPLLLKLSPDLNDSQLEFCLKTSLKMGFDGWVLTNTTLSRPDSLKFSNEGGLSGRPLASISKSILKKSIQILGSSREDRLIVSVGGIMTADDVFERLEMGADLLEVYSALIFDGPWFFEDVAQRATNKSRRQSFSR